MAYGDEPWYFESTGALLGILANTDEADTRHLDLPNPEGKLILEGRYVNWLVDSNYVVMIDADKIHFTDENNWYPRHAKALLELIESGEQPVFEIPAGRVERITKAEVTKTQKEYDNDELEYQRGMVKPWNKSDANTLYAYLLDGNHRALAAIAAGEPQIPVVVGQNYRENVNRREWI